VSIIPVEECENELHLKRVLREVTKKKGKLEFNLRSFDFINFFSGEGVMIYHPGAPYTSGRTSNLLKVKVSTKE
jgi:ATP-dependent DNA ligase